MMNQRLAAQVVVIIGVILNHCEGLTLPEQIDDIFIGYDNRIPPKYNETGSKKQVSVEVNMFIHSMFDISESNMDYSMSMFLRERWMDRRLAYDNVLNLTRIELDVRNIDKVWQPDMYVLNEKKSYFHEVMVPNKLLHIYPDGTVQLSARVTGTFSCEMHLEKYPFDTQNCHFIVESYGYSTDSLQFRWSDSPVKLTKGLNFPQFELTENQYYECNKDYFGIIYPCIGVKFTLVRNYGYYITQIYIPSILIVILSWVNFWLDPASVPARISLGLLTVLTMTTQSSGARAGLPQVSYVKAIDVWMATCLAFVFLGLVQFACVNVQMRKINRRLSANKHENGNTNENDYETKKQDISVELPPKTGCPCFKDLEGIDRARLIDKASRILFPLAFVIFNIVYWLVYMIWYPDFIEEE